MGVDENGLGPVLGPLVTTAVGLELGSRYQPARLHALGQELGIDDSKATAAFGRMAVAEGLALALVESLTSERPAHADALLSGLLLEEPASMRGRCPESSRPQCWSAPIALPCFGGEIEQGREVLRALAQRSVRVARVRSAVACTRMLNDRLAVGQSRVEVDLELMERLLLDTRAALGQELHAICGMVGGIRNYPDKVRHLPRERMTPRRATGGTLAYDVAGLGHVRFEIDADQTHMPVAFASMVGKYVRELWMLRHNRFYQASDPALADVSGYHDPVTKRFIAMSAVLRRRLGIEDACFVRDSAQQLADRLQLPLFPPVP